jgi:hypothetical protein
MISLKMKSRKIISLGKKSLGCRFKSSVAAVTAMETEEMNLFTAIKDAMSIAMKADDSVIVFGEDVAFGGVFRCS